MSAALVPIALAAGIVVGVALGLYWPEIAYRCAVLCAGFAIGGASWLVRREARATATVARVDGGRR